MQFTIMPNQRTKIPQALSQDFSQGELSDSDMHHYGTIRKLEDPILSIQCEPTLPYRGPS
jgi:hypothetical protein